MLSFKDFKLFSSDKLILSVNDLTLDKSTFNYILGDNATGKSLLINTLAGEYPNYKGSIFLNKQVIKNQKHNNSILKIDDSLPVIKDLSFLEHLEMPFSKLSSLQNNRIIEMATIVECMDLLNTKTGFLSKSEKMLMYLVRAVLISPSLLLIDDFDVFFDNDYLKKVYQLFLSCLKSGMIIICTGKSNIKNITKFKLNSGALEKLCHSQEI